MWNIFQKVLKYAIDIIQTLYRLGSLRIEDGFSCSQGWNNWSIVN